MDIKTSIFWRDKRTKKTARLGTDGAPLMYDVKGTWVYRIRYTDQNGKLCCIERGGFPKNQKRRCSDRMDEMVAKVRASFGRIKSGERMTFNQLADKCEELFYKPAVIRHGQKIAGVRSWRSVVGQISNLRQYFGARLINSITTDSLFLYREWRMEPQESSRPGGPTKNIKFATVNRELSAMRRMMRYAKSKGWVTIDIFENAKVIEISKEKERANVLSRSQELALINACSGTWSVPYKRTRKGKTEEITATFEIDNWQLRAMIILAVETGMRRGEILKLQWKDIDFDSRIIRILGTHTKTEKERIVPLNDRVLKELERIRPLSKGDSIFLYSDCKRAFQTAKRLAGINDLRFHDLRSTFATRMAKLIPLSQLKDLMGHAELKTTLKYYVTSQEEDMDDIRRIQDSQYTQGDVNSVSATEMVN